ncbi:WD repeat-containing protein 25 [Petromyzon marinus]|uniref:WD repeat-containing protein 25 n=1 Tax=Petromyzon marinus TaxID=7757 RepID=UPI003F6E97DD
MKALLAYGDSDSDAEECDIGECGRTSKPGQKASSSLQVIAESTSHGVVGIIATKSGTASNSNSSWLGLNSLSTVNTWAQHIDAPKPWTSSPTPWPLFAQKQATAEQRAHGLEHSPKGKTTHAAPRRPYVPKRQRLSEQDTRPPESPSRGASPLFGAIRPYVSKRQRLGDAGDAADRGGASEDGNAAAADGGGGAGGIGMGQGGIGGIDGGRAQTTSGGGAADHSALIRGISPVVAPYLDCKYSGTQLTSRVYLELAGHGGAVNALRWCPVRTQSHLLLTASMDKTVKVWDGVGHGLCVQTLRHHTAAVRSALWMPCGGRVLTGGFDSATCLSDVETGQVMARIDHGSQIMCLALHPCQPNLFISGGFSSAAKAWDLRTCKALREFRAPCQQVLAMLFLRGGDEFISSTDAVSRDSPDRTLLAWDLGTGARISNQIFHERYTCPSLCLHPREPVFAAQTNGNYIAVFSAQRPYSMDKKKRFEGHTVEGYGVACEFSRDGSLLGTGSADGSARFYCPRSGRLLASLAAHAGGPCLSATFHPVLPRTLATAGWDGGVRVWN